MSLIIGFSYKYFNAIDEEKKNVCMRYWKYVKTSIYAMLDVAQRPKTKRKQRRCKRETVPKFLISTPNITLEDITLVFVTSWSC